MDVFPYYFFFGSDDMDVFPYYNKTENDHY